MVHFDNLESIFRRRALLSKERVMEEGINYRSIALEDVQDLRDRVFIWDFSLQRPRSLHSYVPFYFATHTPMLYMKYKDGLQNEIVFFEGSRSILLQPGVVFTNGNATNQQLAKYRDETVLVIPATPSSRSCTRKYSSTVPLGTNQNRSDFYADVDFLKDLNWDVINDRWFNEEEKTRIKHAEVLVPDVVPLGKVQGIVTSSYSKANAVNALIERCGLANRIPFAVSRPGLYFS